MASFLGPCFDFSLFSFGYGIDMALKISLAATFLIGPEAHKLLCPAAVLATPTSLFVHWLVSPLAHRWLC